MSTTINSANRVSVALLLAVMVLGYSGVLGTLDWVKVVKFPACNTYEVTLFIDCDRPWFAHHPPVIRPTTVEPPAHRFSFSELCEMCREGIETYWSRNIGDWAVKIKTVLIESGDRKKIELQWRRSGSRSHNSDILKMVVKFLSHRADAVPLFKETCAHEIGHSFLNDAHGLIFSWGHKGTSSIFGGIKDDAPFYPDDGEIDLMLYYHGYPPPDYFGRVIANESDVEDLVFVVPGSFTIDYTGC